MNASLEIALSAYIPKLADHYAVQISRVFDSAIKALGPTLRNVHNDHRFARMFSSVGLCHGIYSRLGNRHNDPVVFSTDRVAEKCLADAEATVASLRIKIEGKLQEITNGEVIYLNGHCFSIRGERAGRKVYIEQNMIVNVSSKGTLFNQFPARIYLDGKFVSEAQYKGAF